MYGEHFSPTPITDMMSQPNQATRRNYSINDEMRQIYRGFNDRYRTTEGRYPEDRVRVESSSIARTGLDQAINQHRQNNTREIA